MIGYATNTGTLRNLEVIRAAGWRLFITPSNHRLPKFPIRFAIDNGAWTAWKQARAFPALAFLELIERHGPAADFVVVPDIVARGQESLTFSLSWLPRLRNIRHLLLPVQDGMNAEEVGDVLAAHPNLGLFLGGSTEWKLETMYAWGMVAHAFRRHYHVGRVNSRRRIRLCAEAGADSFDGTCVSRYSCKMPRLDDARKQPSLLTPARLS